MAIAPAYVESERNGSRRSRAVPDPIRYVAAAMPGGNRAADRWRSAPNNTAKRMAAATASASWLGNRSTVAPVESGRTSEGNQDDN